MLDYDKLLNRAQRQVVSAGNGSMLVAAGAGSGKTRTIVYRLTWLVEHGVEPWHMLLLTFTRKAAREMVDRATTLFGGSLGGLWGGTFHSFAYRVLRQYRPAWLEGRAFTVIDAPDQQSILKRTREAQGIGKGERGFPKTQSILGYLSKARNKEVSLSQVLSREAPQLLGYEQELCGMAEAYRLYKRENGLLDYDDLLFELEDLLRGDGAVLAQLRDEYRHILVDEYQDTNMVQARLIQILAGVPAADRSLMAVGDEAQSIYAFRGATVRNILDFPQIFPGCRVVPLEENYRSVQAVLDVANTVMSHAQESYAKNLTAVRPGQKEVRIVRCRTDVEQGKCVARHIAALLEEKKPSDIAVLFRVGYQSYQTEVELTALDIPYRKYGGLRYQEAAHVKDLLAYLHLIVNPDDGQSFVRVACMHDRIGPKTAEKIFAALRDPKLRAKQAQSHPRLFGELDLLAGLRTGKLRVADIIDEVLDLYRPHLEEQYPEDYPHRELGLQELQAIAAEATDLDLFLADVQLDSVDTEERRDDCVTLSTIHSAKGLEWNTVMILDLVQGRFPSRHAEFSQETMEEERRLMYVACTRARDTLELYYYGEGSMRGNPRESCEMSDFLAEIQHLPVIRHCQGSAQGRIVCAGREPARPRPSWRPDSVPRRADPEPAVRIADQPAGGEGQYVPASARLSEIRQGLVRLCRHRVFGEGRIIGLVEPDRLVVLFPVLGKKVILANYLFVRETAGG